MRRQIAQSVTGEAGGLRKITRFVADNGGPLDAAFTDVQLPAVAFVDPPIGGFALLCRFVPVPPCLIVAYLAAWAQPYSTAFVCSAWKQSLGAAFCRGPRPSSPGEQPETTQDRFHCFFVLFLGSSACADFCR